MPVERLEDLRRKIYSRRGASTQREERLAGTVRPTGVGRMPVVGRDERPLSSAWV